jgi:hypothetical protein
VITIEAVGFHSVALIWICFSIGLKPQFSLRCPRPRSCRRVSLLCSVPQGREENLFSMIFRFMSDGIGRIQKSQWLSKQRSGRFWWFMKSYLWMDFKKSGLFVFAIDRMKDKIVSLSELHLSMENGRSFVTLHSQQSSGKGGDRNERTGPTLHWLGFPLQISLAIPTVGQIRASLCISSDWQIFELIKCHNLWHFSRL